MKNLLLVIFCFIRINSFSQFDHLIPVKGIFSSYEFEFQYNVPLRALLFKNLENKFIARIIVKPSFQPEYLISIEKLGDSFLLCYNTLSESFWYLKDTLKIKTNSRKINIDQQFSETIRDVFNQFIVNTKYPNEQINGADGTTYEFMTFKIGVGLRAGETWSPQKGTKMRKLTDLSNMLKDMCVNSNYKTQKEAILSYCKSFIEP